MPGSSKHVIIAVNASGEDVYSSVVSNTNGGRTSGECMVVIPARLCASQQTMDALEHMDATLISKMITTIENYKFTRLISHFCVCLCAEFQIKM